MLRNVIDYSHAHDSKVRLCHFLTTLQVSGKDLSAEAAPSSEAVAICKWREVQQRFIFQLLRPE